MRRAATTFRLPWPRPRLRGTTTLTSTPSSSFRTRITTCYSDRVETGPDFVPGLPHVILIELGQALLSYQDYHMLLLTLAGIHLLAGVLLCVVPVWHTVSTVLSDPRSRYEDEGQGAAARSHIHAQSESAGPQQA